jgi:NhaP-type Na+/H+ or K+/H+ antiporter
VILGLTVVVGFVVVFGLVAVLVIELVRPETDTEPLLRIESEIIGVLVGALVGFIGGRGVGRSESVEVPPPPGEP